MCMLFIQVIRKNKYIIRSLPTLLANINMIIGF